MSTPGEFPISAIANLNLKIKEPPSDFRPSPGEVAHSWTEPFDLNFLNVPGKADGKVAFAVVDLPQGSRSEAEGLLSWNGLKKDTVLSLGFIGQQAYRGQWGSQLMGYAGNEVALLVAELRLALKGPVGRKQAQKNRTRRSGDQPISGGLNRRNY